MSDNSRWFSLLETNNLIPDHDIDSTISNSEGYGIGEGDRRWTLEGVSVVAIDPMQLIDDPADHDGRAKAESIRATFRAGGFVPPVYVLHRPGADYPYFLIEGRHRYNAAHLETITHITAWVGHVDCCGKLNQSLD